MAVGTVFGLVVTALIIEAYSWEWVFYSFGALGIIWFFYWNKLVTSYPEDHKSISKEELEMFFTVKVECACIQGFALTLLLPVISKL